MCPFAKEVMLCFSLQEIGVQKDYFLHPNIYDRIFTRYIDTLVALVEMWAVG